MMQVGGAYIAEVTKLMECVESKEDALPQIVTSQHHINSTLLQTVKNF
jgi:hypothetical protein